MTFNSISLSLKLFWHNPLFGNSLKGKLQIKNTDFWNATSAIIHFFQGSHPSAKLFFKAHLVRKVEFKVFNTMDKIYYWARDVSRRWSTNSYTFSATKLI